jgi:nucleotide-binding universal stress UspA family protein
VPVDPLPKDADPAFLEAKGKLAELALGNSLGVRPAEMLLERGEVWDVISDIIQMNKIDLVVTGTHGRQGLKKLVLGSEAEKIYRKQLAPY